MTYYRILNRSRSKRRLRLGVVVAELQRQGAEDRRLVQRQLDHLDRRLQESFIKRRGACSFVPCVLFLGGWVVLLCLLLGRGARFIATESELSNSTGEEQLAMPAASRERWADLQAFGQLLWGFRGGCPAECIAAFACRAASRGCWRRSPDWSGAWKASMRS